MSTQEIKQIPSTFQVRLTRHNRTWEFPRQRYLKLFPNSLLAQALEDPDASVIDLDNPLVTPDIVSYLHFITTYPYAPPRREVDVRSAWAYLNIPVFRIAHNPSLMTLASNHDDNSDTMAPNLLDAKALAQRGTYWRLTHNALLKNDPEVLDYVFERVPPGATKEMDIRLMYEVIINGWSQFYPRLLKRGVDVRRDVLPKGSFIDLLPPNFQYYQPDEGVVVQSDDRFDISILRDVAHCDFDQLPYLMILAQQTMSSGHREILTETLRRELLSDDLLLRMVSQYILVGNPLEKVVLQLFQAIRQFPVRPIDYQPITELKLARVYTYLREERQLPDPDELVNAAALNLHEYIIRALKDEGISPDQWWMAFRMAAKRGNYELAATICPKLDPSIKAQLASEAEPNLAMLRILIRDPVVTRHDLGVAIFGIVFDRNAGTDALRVYLEFDPTLGEYIQHGIDETERTLEPEWRQALVELLAEYSRS